MNEVAADKGVLIMDLARRMKPGSECYYDGTHFNKCGAGAEVAEFFVKKKLLDGVRGGTRH